MPRDAVRLYAESIKIPYLVHFTRVDNLPTILHNGLYPVGRIGEIGVTPHINDHERWDGRLDGISMSIALPNSQMFYKCRSNNPGVEWAVLVFDKSVLWEKDCAFCNRNAASNHVRHRDLDDLRKPDSFYGMFEEIDGVESRESQKLKPFDTTDVQAEVLVFDVIEPKYIKGAAFETEVVKNKYESIFGARKLVVNGVGKKLFAARSYLRLY